MAVGRRIVKVTRRGQTTIPVEFRKRYRIEEGSKLVAEARDDGIIFRPVASLEDLGGFLAGVTTVNKLTKILEESREEGE